MKYFWGVFLLCYVNAQSVLLKKHPYATLGVDTYLTASTSAGDLDDDGDIDIVVANGRHWSQFNKIFLNDGKGFFRRSKLLGDEANTSYMAITADIDNDGDLDILVANDRIKNQIFINNSKGEFSFKNYFGRQESITRGICVADLNQDGYVDIIEANRTSQNYIYYNNSKGSFLDETPFGGDDEATISIAASDLNLDGYIDLILANRNKQPNRIYFGPDFLSSSVFGSGKDETRQVAIGDMDGDGYPDIVAVNIGEKIKYSTIMGQANLKNHYHLDLPQTKQCQ